MVRGAHSPSDAAVIAAGPLVRAAVERSEAGGLARAELVAFIVHPSAPMAPALAALDAAMTSAGEYAPPRVTSDGSRVFIVPRASSLDVAVLVSEKLRAIVAEPVLSGEVRVLYFTRREVYATCLAWDPAPIEEPNFDLIVAEMLRQWPETAHLAKHLEGIARPIRTKANTVENGYAVRDALPILEEFVAIAAATPNAPPEMRLVAQNIRESIPGLRAQLRCEPANRPGAN
jgi:hypothetical protein